MEISSKNAVGRKRRGPSERLALGRSHSARRERPRLAVLLRPGLQTAARSRTPSTSAHRTAVRPGLLGQPTAALSRPQIWEVQTQSPTPMTPRRADSSGCWLCSGGRGAGDLATQPWWKALAGGPRPGLGVLYTQSPQPLGPSVPSTPACLALAHPPSLRCLLQPLGLGQRSGPGPARLAPPAVRASHTAEPASSGSGSEEAGKPGHRTAPPRPMGHPDSKGPGSQSANWGSAPD